MEALQKFAERSQENSGKLPMTLENGLPNFFIIGAAKAATTSLASLLDQHPEAALSVPKEPHFFSNNTNFSAGIEKYKQCFLYDPAKTKAIGDASTSYSRLRKNPNTIQRIKQVIPKPKFIYMVRNPIRRIESAYVEQMTTLPNQDIRSINEAINKIPMIIDSSRYWETYLAYRKHFRKTQIHIVWFEEYITNQNSSYAGACRFLAIDSTFIPCLKTEVTNKRNDAYKRLTQNTTIDTHWNSKTLKHVKKTLSSDTRKFLEYFDKPKDYWDD